MKLFLTTLMFLLTFPASANDALDTVLAAQSDENKARYEYRHPKETLEFFGITPDMTVIEALPGKGWYSKILIPYLGPKGKLVGLDYDISIWNKFSWPDEAFIEKRRSWPDTWSSEANAWYGDSGAEVSAITMGTVPEDLHGKADSVLFIRALHNIARVKDDKDYFAEAMNAAYVLLKPDGVLGVVQHHARDDRADSWADGSSGYLKKGALIDRIEAAGFEFVGETDINSNADDQADEGDEKYDIQLMIAKLRKHASNHSK